MIDRKLNIAIVGSRDYSSYDEVAALVKRLAAKYPQAEIISGGARGVDTWAAHAAHDAGLWLREYVPCKATTDPHIGKWFISARFLAPDRGAGTSPLTNLKTGEGFFPTFAKCAHVRNQMIVDHSDVIVAVWDGKSAGTRSTISKAIEAEKFCLIYRKGAWMSPEEAGA